MESYRLHGSRKLCLSREEQCGSWITLIENSGVAFDEPYYTFIVLKTRLPYQRTIAKNPEHHVSEPERNHKFQDILLDGTSET